MWTLIDYVDLWMMMMGGESELMEDGEQGLEYEDSDSDIDGEDN